MQKFGLNSILAGEMNVFNGKNDGLFFGNFRLEDVNV